MFSVEDTNGDDVTTSLKDDPTSPAATAYSITETSKGRYTLAWTPTNLANVSLTLMAEDSRGEKTYLRLFIILCPCQNGGECTSIGASYNDDLLLQVQRCYCPKGWGRSVIPSEEY